LLSDVVASVVDHNVSVFSIGVEVLVLNFNNLALLVDDESTLVSEQLPPS
jgi:hypothetical protein